MNNEKLTYKQILIFWLPLAATWMMMSIENPFLTAIIARMPEPKYNLAAYGVAFSFAILIESPVIMMMSASTALVKDWKSFLKLRRFSYSLNFTLTGVMLLILIPPVYDFLALDLIGLPLPVAELTYFAMIILVPWPGAIGYRRLFQGILINSNQTRKVAYGTIIRLVSMTSTAIILYSFFDFHGIIVGACALSAGVVMEALFSKVMVKDILKRYKENVSDDTVELSFREIFNFYYPLVLTSVVALGVHPMVTFFLGQSRMALESLAVLPVINGFVFIFRGVGLSFQEVGIALLDTPNKTHNYKKLRNFATVGGISVVLLLVLIAFTPLSELWFEMVAGLSVELSNFAIQPLMIMTLMPGLTFLISFQRSILLTAKHTKPITMATIIEVSSIILILLITINWLNWVGVIAATSAYILGRLIANTYLMKPMLQKVRNY
jgi:progressive ankylosis protein